MKRVEFSTTFIENFKQRIAINTDLLKQFDENFALFMKGKRGKPINDHSLQRELVGLRAFSINKDIRVIYQETNNAYIFQNIGTHRQVY